MKLHKMFRDSLLDDLKLRAIEDSIYSVIPKEEQEHHYDNAARFYDLIIGNRFYNRIIWGNWPEQYRDFCRKALNSIDSGLVLDAGCGSLVFTGKVYAQCERPVILMDRSLSMLRRAKSRLIRQAGKAPESGVCDVTTGGYFQSALLQKHNEVALCETSNQLQQRLKLAGVDCELSTIGNMAYFVKIDEATSFTRINENKIY